MQEHKPAMIYKVENGKPQFVGYGVLNGTKLTSLRIWENPADVEKIVKQHNESAILHEHWPYFEDPEVQALIKDPEWEPMEMVEEQIPDMENSVLAEDEVGGVDWAESQVKYTTALVPKDPAAAQLRVHKAMETVARKRANL